MNNPKKIIIATGGTGGHIFPAYGLAQHFISNKINVEIVSDKRGLKFLKNIPNIKIIKISSATIFKKNIFKILFSSIIILFSLIKSFIYLITNRPDLVFGMGGYSSFPICIAAKTLGIPFIIYENNLCVGKANQYLLPFAKKIFVSFQEVEGIPKKYDIKTCKIGNIIREEFLNYQSQFSQDASNKKLNILILGGSQAAKVFAEKLPEVFKKCSDANLSFKIYQQCLPQQNKILTSFYERLKIDFEIFNFSNNILDYFSKTNLVITRAGASMLAELINSKIPFICIPLPTAADNHQFKNALYYKKHDYAYLVEEKDLEAKLFHLIKDLNDNQFLLEEIIKKQKQFSDKTVYQNINHEIKKIFNEKN